MNQERRRVVRGHVSHRLEGDEFHGLGLRVPSRNGLRPNPLLPTILIKTSAIPFAVARVRDRRPGDLSERLLSRKLALMVPRVRAGLAVPRSREVAIPPEGHERLQTRLDPVADNQ